MEPKTLLDTDVLSGLMRKNPSPLNQGVHGSGGWVRFEVDGSWTAAP